MKYSQESLGEGSGEMTNEPTTKLVRVPEDVWRAVVEALEAGVKEIGHTPHYDDATYDAEWEAINAAEEKMDAALEAARKVKP
jgi:hypothetical protein